MEHTKNKIRVYFIGYLIDMLLKHNMPAGTATVKMMSEISDEISELIVKRDDKTWGTPLARHIKDICKKYRGAFSQTLINKLVPFLMTIGVYRKDKEDGAIYYDRDTIEHILERRDA